MLHYRNADLQDLARIVEIYNSTIPSRLVTADTEPITVESRIDWFHSHNPGTRPLWIVENEHNETIAWVSFKSFYGRPAYNGTVEIGIYLDENFRGKGFGKMILAHCIAVAPNMGIKTLLGFIFSHNTPSMKLFEQAGFVAWGNLPNVALMDGKEYGLSILGKRID
jgi:L-amino acid N-acyltransferase YncA